MSRNSQDRNRQAGFTLMEMLITLFLTVLMVGMALSVLISQMRSYETQQGTMRARQTLRGAATLLTSELRHASGPRGDLAAIGPQALTIRSIIGAGVVCDTLGARYGVWQPVGAFEPTAQDSVLAFSVSGKSWTSMRVSQVWGSPSAGGIPSCAWTGGGTPGLVIEVVPTVAADTAGVRIGSGLRAYRLLQYGIFQRNGSWWLGRRPAAAISYDILTGPLHSPSDSGMAFHYYDAAGTETTNPTQVVRIELELRAVNAARVSSDSGLTMREDSLAVTTLLRN